MVVLPRRGPDYDPYNLPRRLDFHREARKFPLERVHKTKLQLALSRMNKAQIKKTIKRLEEMEYDCLEGKAKIEWEKIEKHIKTKDDVAEIAPELRDDLKMAVWCRFCRHFAENYLYTLEQQKKI